MGVRINVYLAHDLPPVEDTEGRLLRLKPTIPAALAVRKYWESVAPDYRDSCHGWATEPPWKGIPHLQTIEGPGSLWLSVASRLAKIYTGGRYRGFLENAPMRDVHLQAFCDIAMALNSPLMAICSCTTSDSINALLGDQAFEQCVAELREHFGPPFPSVQEIPEGLWERIPRGGPSPWFLEQVQPS